MQMGESRTRAHAGARPEDSHICVLIAASEARQLLEAPGEHFCTIQYAFPPRRARAGWRGELAGGRELRVLASPFFKIKRKIVHSNVTRISPKPSRLCIYL